MHACASALAVLKPSSGSEDPWVELPLVTKVYVAARAERSGATASAAMAAAARRGDTALEAERVCLFCGQEVTD